MSVTVTTQAELDAALAANETVVYISSPEGVWLRVANSDSSHVVARDSSHVVARDSSHVVARDSSHVEARDSSHVVARDSSHVEARDSSHVVARDSSHVVAWGSSHVEAWGSSHVVAWGSSHVEAWDSSHVEARPFVAVHLRSGRAQVDGGVLIDLTRLDLSDPTVWADFHGVNSTDGHLIVYKAVDDDLRSGRGMHYPLGGTVTAKDWKPTDACGNGLHFGPTPRHARAYHDGATRFLACRIPLAAARGITDGGTAKVKAASCEVLHEVDLDGRPLSVAVTA
jgi:hypothetical protein